jgi:iron complex outermembrane receptor protein
LPSLLLGVAVISVGDRAVLAQPTPSDTPNSTPSNPPANPPATPPASPPTGNQAQAAPAPAAPQPPAPGDAPAPAAPQPPAAPPAPVATGTITGVVRAPDLDAPLAGATVTVAGTSITALTDDAGRFTINVPAGHVILHTEFAGFANGEQQLEVTAGSASAVTIAMTLQQLLTEVVVVVGSRTPRTNVETTAPVDVVTAEEIAHVGKTETGRILSTVAPSFISTPQTVSDGTDHVDPASLRGLGPDQVLVLINGKRRHKSALLNVNGTFGRGTVGTDLNSIPSGSIKRIEILRDGAASQYGSDAIAGVINIVTKDYTDLLDVDTLTGITGSGDGGQIRTSANYGFKLGRKGFLNITGELLKKDPTNRAGTYTGYVYTDPKKPTPFSPVPDPDMSIDNSILAMNHLTRDDFRMKIGEASAEDAMGSFNLELPIDDVSTFYSFGDLSHRTGAAGGFYRYPAASTQNVYALYPNGFLPEIHSNINDLGITIGVRRKGDWTVDASLTHGMNSFQFNVENSVNASLGTLSPTTFDAGTLTAAETLADLDLLHKIDTGGALKSLNFVAGTEVRSESYQITPGDVASYTFGGAMTTDSPPLVTAPGAQVFPGFQPSNAVNRDRSNVGVYAGVESEVIKGLDVDAGGRYENYSDFGNAFTAKLAARVPITKEIALRGAASTGFRAPSLQQLWFSNVSSVFTPDATGALVPRQVLTANNASPITREAFGIPKLKQETSYNLSGGATARPLDNLSITADGYFIRLDNRIVLTNQFAADTTTAAGMDVGRLLSPFPGVSAAQFFANAIDTDTFGLDVVADYTISTKDTGKYTLSAAANFTKTEVIGSPHIPSSLAAAFSGGDATQLKNFFFDRLSRNRIEDSVPHQKGNVTARYNFEQWSALLRANYYGRVIYKPDLVSDSETFGAKVLFDADVGYQFTRYLQFTIGADNLLNTFPDKNTKPDNISLGRFVYNRNVSQFGWNGGFYFARLELTFY